MAEIVEILTERGKRYGKFTGHAMITQILKLAAHGEWGSLHGLLSQASTPSGNAVREKWLTLPPDQREALDMVFHKVGRILNGDPDYSDSWADIAGYAKLVADRLDGIER